tara:strand:- start:430 stop:1182 length:753 start_codon:yes stop_codon:yes gene_type:complete
VKEQMNKVLDVKSVSKRFGGVQALDDVSIHLNEGEVLALAGDNGAGKSTLIKVISGVYHPDDGDIIFNNENIQLDNPRFAREKGIETIYQDLALADNLNVGANIFLGREPMTTKFGVPIINRELMLSESKKVLKNLEINIPESSLEEPVGKLSGGQRQAVAIGRALYWNAKLLIMDEPTAALGVPEQRNVMDLIKKLKEQKVSIIFISHNLTDIFQASDRIVVLRRGIKAGERMISETNSDEIVKLMVQG